MMCLYFITHSREVCLESKIQSYSQESSEKSCDLEDGTIHFTHSYCIQCLEAELLIEWKCRYPVEYAKPSNKPSNPPSCGPSSNTPILAHLLSLVSAVNTYKHCLSGNSVFTKAWGAGGPSSLLSLSFLLVLFSTP